jgi:hypothetical protein
MINQVVDEKKEEHLSGGKSTENSADGSYKLHVKMQFPSLRTTMNYGNGQTALGAFNMANVSLGFEVNFL